MAGISHGRAPSTTKCPAWCGADMRITIEDITSAIIIATSLFSIVVAAFVVRVLIGG